MLFNSIEYLFLFIPVVFVIYFLLNKYKKYKSAAFFLFLASLYFYGTYKVDYVYIILLSILFNFFIGSLFKKDLSPLLKKIILIAGVGGNILLLIFFKYVNTLIEVYNNITLSHFNTLEIIIPLGISYFTLQQISYIADCYKGIVKNYSIIYYSLYICFFPQFVAGPIVRHQEMIPQFENLKNRVINQKNIYIGLFLITVGLLKKTVFADGFSDFLDDCMLFKLCYNNFFASWCWCGSKLLQVYFDYSGYCDMAIGSSFLFNISLPWNFNSPYKATGIIDFWKRWNMTLVRFLKDYVYKPLGADKKGMFKYCVNVIFVFLLYGIWGGTNIVNITYGFINGVLICINKLWNKLHIELPKFVARFITMLTLMFIAPFIFMDHLSQSFNIIKSMCGICRSFDVEIRHYNIIFENPYPSIRLNLILLFVALFIVLFSKNSTELSRIYVKSNNLFNTIILVLVFVYAVLSITKSSEFIYFIF